MKTKGKGGPYTLAIDVGGTGLKAMVLDGRGKPINERVRIETPRPATPNAVFGAIQKLIAHQPAFDRVSVGFPGVVVNGVAHNAPNLDGIWTEVDLAKEVSKRAKKPTRVANDADVQGLGVIEGKGVELVLTLGTGIGSGLFLEGKLVPNLELGHHPWRKGKTYEDCLDNARLDRLGSKKWSNRLREALGDIQRVFNPRIIYLGGGNAKKIKGDMPDNVKIVDNTAGILGGIKLWA
jgi:polyphosphate glucokinase